MWMCECLHICASYTLGAHRDQKRSPDSQKLITDVGEPPYERWDLGALQEEQLFLLLSHRSRLQFHYFCYLRKA